MFGVNEKPTMSTIVVRAGRHDAALSRRGTMNAVALK
jgi:hypothetical protein